MDVVIAIDQGTSSTRCIAFALDGSIRAQSSSLLTMSYPDNAWVEQDPVEIIRTVEHTLAEVVTRLEHQDDRIISMGIANQRETVVLWDPHTGQAYYPAIVWQDRRTHQQCAALAKTPSADMIRQKTGLLCDPYFSASKIQWVIDHIDAARRGAQAGRLICGTIDCFVLWHLTDGRAHATDATNASRSLLWNIHTQQWDQELLDLWQIKSEWLPEVKDNVSTWGQVQRTYLKSAIPIHAMMGDQQASAMGQNATTPGAIKATFGTGGFVLLNTGEECVIPSQPILTTLASRFKGQASYAYEGSIFNAGVVLQWLGDAFPGLLPTPGHSDELARQLASSDGVYFVPAFTGLGAPYWDPNARGSISGLTRSSSFAHIVRAGLEGVCFQTRDLFEVLKQYSCHELPVLSVDGGMSDNDWFMQCLADTLQCTVVRAACREATAWGVACLAAWGSDAVPHYHDLVGSSRQQQSFSPQVSIEEAGSIYQGWIQAVNRTCTSRFSLP